MEAGNPSTPRKKYSIFDRHIEAERGISSKLARIRQQSGSQESNAQEFTIEKIMAERYYRGEHQYLVRWRDCSRVDDSWVQSTDVNDEKMIRYFLKNEGNLLKEKEDEPMLVPEEVMESRKNEKGDLEYLVKWTGLSHVYNSWAKQDKVNPQLIKNFLKETEEIEKEVDFIEKKMSLMMERKEDQDEGEKA